MKPRNALRRQGMMATDADNDVLTGIAAMSTGLHEGRLRITDRCPHLLREIPSYAWDPKAAERGQDKPIKADVRYDAAIDQMQLLLREEPQVGKAYAVTITTGVKDLRGNAMAANYSWTFTIADVRQPAEQPSLYLPVVKR